MQSITSDLGSPPEWVLIHTPHNNSAAERESVWRGLIEAKGAGLARHIGVSNFDQAQISALHLLGVSAFCTAASCMLVFCLAVESCACPAMSVRARWVPGARPS